MRPIGATRLVQARLPGLCSTLLFSGAAHETNQRNQPGCCDSAVQRCCMQSPNPAELTQLSTLPRVQGSCRAAVGLLRAQRPMGRGCLGAWAFRALGANCAHTKKTFLHVSEKSPWRRSGLRRLPRMEAIQHAPQRSADIQYKSMVPHNGNHMHRESAMRLILSSLKASQL